METYIQTCVDINWDSGWFKYLRKILRGLKIQWQHGHYHITMAFIENTPDGVDVNGIAGRAIGACSFPLPMKFDTIGVFTAEKRGEHIIYLTASVPPEAFTTLVESLRRDLHAAGCSISYYPGEFKLHITLGSIDRRKISLEDLQKCISEVKVAEPVIMLSRIEHVTHTKSHHILKDWRFLHKPL